jgi:hypothetical protein
MPRMRMKTTLAFWLSATLCGGMIVSTGGGCRGNSAAISTNSASRSAQSVGEVGSAPAGKAALADVGLSQITGGYRVCSPRALHGCRAHAVTRLGSVTFPVTDIAASPACEQQEQRAAKDCAGAGKPYDAVNLKCLAAQGILNKLLHDDSAPGAGARVDERQRLTVRCAEGETWIDLFARL